ncbi:hypothetical protein GCM10027059_48270 [Myceligenerans halotolerans]
MLSTIGRPQIEPGRWGEISVKEIRPGVYRARTTYRHLNGRYSDPTAQAKSRNAARTKLENKLHAMSRIAPESRVGAVTPSSKMDDVITEWVRERRQEGEDAIRGQSLDSYGSVIKNHIRPSIGKLRVQEVTPVAINRTLESLHLAGKYDTARQAKNVLRQVMAMCVRYGAIATNPVIHAAPVRKKRTRKDVRTLSLDEVVTLREAVLAWEHRPPKRRGKRNTTLLPEIVDTMLGTGLRIGECLALREDDLRLNAEVPTLTVNGTVARADPDASGRRRLYRQPKPKSDSSIRTVTLPEFVVAALRRALDLALDGGPDGLVFPSTKATPRSPGRVREQIKEALTGTGVKIAPHDFRRTVGDLLDDKLDTKTAQLQLGHSSEATTLRHYVRRKNIAPDVRTVLDKLIESPAADASDEAPGDAA